MYKITSLHQIMPLWRYKTGQFFMVGFGTKAPEPADLYIEREILYAYFERCTFSFSAGKNALKW